MVTSQVIVKFIWTFKHNTRHICNVGNTFTFHLSFNLYKLLSTDEFHHWINRFEFCSQWSLCCLSTNVCTSHTHTHFKFFVLLPMLHICMALISYMNTRGFIQFTLANLCQLLQISITDLRGIWRGMGAMSYAYLVHKPLEATYSLHTAQLWKYILILQLILNLYL